MGVRRHHTDLRKQLGGLDHVAIVLLIDHALRHAFGIPFALAARRVRWLVRVVILLLLHLLVRTQCQDVVRLRRVARDVVQLELLRRGRLVRLGKHILGQIASVYSFLR